MNLIIKTNIWDGNLSNAAAKTLNYLLENKLMEIKNDAKFTINNGTCTPADSSTERS